jgi:6-phosphogluconolactonase
MRRDPLTRRSFVRMTGLASVAAQSKWLHAAVGSDRWTDLASSRRPRFAFVGATGPNEGVHLFAIENERWSLRQIVRSAAPVSLALHPSSRTLYVLNEISEFQGLPTGSVEAYRIDKSTRQLDLLGRQALSLSATMPRHLAVSPDGKSLAVAVHGGGAYNLLPILEDGQLGRVRSILKETGSGPANGHQETAHPQSIVFDPTGSRFIAADLGSDRVSVLSVEDGLGALVRHTMPPGSGPRNLALHPNGQLLVVDHALDGSLSLLRYDSATGTITKRGPRLHGPFGSALAIDPSGDFLYAAGPAELNVWRIKPSIGALTRLQSQPMEKEVTAIVPHPNGSRIFAVTSKGVLRIKFDVWSEKQKSSALMAAVNGARCLAIL